MIIKRLITFVIALSLAFSVSTAMAGKSDKSDKSWKYSEKSDKSWKRSDKSDKSWKGKKRKGKKWKKGRRHKHSDKSGKSGKSDKSDKSGKSDKSDKEPPPPPACVSSWSFSVVDSDEETGAPIYGEITGTACTADEVNEIIADEYSSAASSSTTCKVDEEFSVFPDLSVDGPYELNLGLPCEDEAPPPPPPSDD